jgi:hypothetical protein
VTSRDSNRPCSTGRNHRQGLQGVHSHLGHEARQDFAVLAAIERQDRTPAQITQRGVHSPRHAAFARRCAAFGGGLLGALQQRAFEQRHRLHHTEGHARRASAGDSGRPGSETASARMVLRAPRRQLPTDGIVRINIVGNSTHMGHGSRKLRGVDCEILLGFATQTNTK